MKLKKFFISYRRLKNSETFGKHKPWQTFDVHIFFKKKFCLMSSLKFTLSDVTCFYLTICLGLKIVIFRPEAITWVLVKWTDADGVYHWRIFEVAIESWSEWDLNPRPLNSVQMLKPTVLSDHYIYKYISIYTYLSIYLSTYLSIYIYIEWLD